MRRWRGDGPVGEPTSQFAPFSLRLYVAQLCRSCSSRRNATAARYIKYEIASATSDAAVYPFMRFVPPCTVMAT